MHDAHGVNNKKLKSWCCMFDRKTGAVQRQFRRDVGNGESRDLRDARRGARKITARADHGSEVSGLEGDKHRRESESGHSRARNMTN